MVQAIFVHVSKNVGSWLGNWREALMVGANAVIAVDLDYSEISGDGKSMLFVVLSGTACRVGKL